jgi:hypothetical protein
MLPLSDRKIAFLNELDQEHPFSNNLQKETKALSLDIAHALAMGSKF